MIEYAISNGRGTLIGYGTAEHDLVGFVKVMSGTSQLPIGWTIITGPASNDCATGQ